MKSASLRMIHLIFWLFVSTLPLSAVAHTPGGAGAVERGANAASVPSAGCGAEGISTGSHTLIHSGISRTYRVYIPSAYNINVPAPVVAFFHGWGGNEDEFAGNEVVTAEADRRGYILVAPRGLGSGAPDNHNNSWTFSGSASGLDGDGINTQIADDTDAICDPENTGDYSYQSCKQSKGNTCSWTHCQADDVDFSVALMEEIKARLCVDSNRVFAMGGSNGGMFTWALGQNPVSAPTFKAIAPLIGLPHRGYLDTQAKDVDMPVILITGTADDTVPPGEWDDPSFTTTSNGSDRYYYTGATAITKRWAQQHHCDTSTNAISFDDGYEEPDCRSYCNNDPGWPRVLDCRAGMGHTYDYDWSWKLILDFFDAHSES